MKLPTRYRSRLAAAAVGGAVLALGGVAGCFFMKDGAETIRARSLSENPYPPDSIWRTPIPREARLDPQNDERMRYWLETSVRHPNLPIREFGVGVFVSSVLDPAYKVDVTTYKGNLMRFGPIRIPDGAKPPPSSDRHVAIYDPVREREWDMWQAECCWSASAGQAQSTAEGDGISPEGTLGADAANFPLLGGLILTAELRRGRIDHALHFSMPEVREGDPVCPATHNDGENSDPLALPEGTRMQLDPNLDVDALQLPRWQKTIARALQRYGMFLRDAGGSLAIAAENTANRKPDLWTPLFGPKTEAPRFSPAFPWDRMRILAPAC
jgi:hypothetical protein